MQGGLTHTAQPASHENPNQSVIPNDVDIAAWRFEPVAVLGGIAVALIGRRTTSTESARVCHANELLRTSFSGGIYPAYPVYAFIGVQTDDLSKLAINCTFQQQLGD